MATASVTNDFTNGTTADAEQVDTNFNDLVTFLNNNVIHVDGSKTMTGNLALGSNKITGLANGTVAADAATVGQAALSSDFAEDQTNVTTPFTLTATGGWEDITGASISFSDPGEAVVALAWGKVAARLDVNFSATTKLRIRVVIDAVNGTYIDRSFPAEDVVEFLAADDYRASWTPAGAFTVKLQAYQEGGTAGDVVIERASIMAAVRHV